MDGGTKTECRMTRPIEIRYKTIEESPIVAHLKQLLPMEQKIMILYAELGSTREVAESLNMNHWTIVSRINRIKKSLTT